jgi:hypothetical protein
MKRPTLRRRRRPDGTDEQGPVLKKRTKRRLRRNRVREYTPPSSATFPREKLGGEPLVDPYHALHGHGGHGSRKVYLLGFVEVPQNWIVVVDFDELHALRGRDFFDLFLHDLPNPYDAGMALHFW